MNLIFNKMSPMHLAEVAAVVLGIFKSRKPFYLNGYVSFTNTATITSLVFFFPLAVGVWQATVFSNFVFDVY